MITVVLRAWPVLPYTISVPWYSRKQEILIIKVWLSLFLILDNILILVVDLEPYFK